MGSLCCFAAFRRVWGITAPHPLHSPPAAGVLPTVEQPLQGAPAHTAARSLDICRPRKNLQKPYQKPVLQVLHRQSGDHLDDDELPLDPCPSAGSPDPILHALQKVGIGLSTLSHLRRSPVRTRRWPYLQLDALSDVCNRPPRLPGPKACKYIPGQRLPM